MFRSFPRKVLYGWVRALRRAYSWMEGAYLNRGKSNLTEI